MKERIREFLLAENKSSAQLAEELGVQPSGISHILSGRNNPSLDFILKMLEKYNYIRTDWLLFGKGAMYKDAKMPNLFNDSPEIKPLNDDKSRKRNVSDIPDTSLPLSKEEPTVESSEFTRGKLSHIVRIIWFYADNSFVEYFPHQK
ncbi:MAG: helix-turn-helix domain-containing protein [Bacteroidales bacterium]|nr:helix-turn-helix domain-containing protein [Bacteroidales bacterium]